MAASCLKIFCRRIHVDKSPNPVKTLFLFRASDTNGVHRYITSGQQIIRNKKHFQYVTNRNQLFHDILLLPRQAQPARQCVTRRHFSNETDEGRGSDEKRVKPIFVAIPNPFKLIRNKIYFWMIRSYFDPEFKAEDFTAGAKQALCTISTSIAEGNFEKLDGLLSKKLLDEVKETWKDMGLRDRANIQVTTDDVLHIFPQNVAVHYDDGGGKFLNILMRFWCHTLASEESDKGVVGMRIGRPPRVSQEEFNNMGSVISCTYEFHRDFSAGVHPNWIVTYIQHGKWLNTEARWLPKEWTR